MQPRLPLYYCDATAAAGCHVGMDRTGHYRHQRIEVAAAAWPLSLVLLVTALLLAPSAVTVARAKATALIVFGDSTVDSGNNDFWPTTARANYPPYGRDFPGGKATGRFCDGLMSTDYLSEYLGLRNIVPAYLDPGYTIKDFAIGVNFASAGTGLDDATAAVFNVIPMSKQVQMFGEYASRLSQDLGEAEAQKVLNGAVYVISIGSNDYALTAMRYMYSPMYTAHLADLARGFVSDMYKVGARKVGFFTLGPLGCIPINRARYGGLICDEAGNAVARAFNDAVRQTAGALNAQLPGLDFRMADLYPIMDAIEKNPPQYGFDHADRACCGTGTFEIGPACMMMSCPDASKYVYWDTVHTTQHTNQIVAAYLMNTTFAALAA